MSKYKYSSENHNWDLTLNASVTLLQTGVNAKNDARLSFSSFTGSMVLAVAALESFFNSLASLIVDEGFDWDNFQEQSVENKLEQLYRKYSLEIDKGKRPLQTIGLAMSWRNRLVHSKPNFVEETEIRSMEEVGKLSSRKSYEYEVNEKFARQFYADILAVIEQLIKVSKINPRAQCTYSPIN
ncbi:MAG: hypothetical protein COV74_04915 [Candidatus Omnitrophica bacterium CG11_big_fil_rev_8_21_14_0_20_45_26]|uniref:RiboL-PSP-HEPN domain-containing protein n=1 Tax=Candidatus Abzuiibacterium crystallinum TaxID=1974748 RepID=A0A2H0LPN6_9BACT|nr:MAG: hypothetical protein COV74_04915 [Candidatus Omnitrophica bacterium CG11_big_fil_rev_8_21_14_0_20_45_26]PIW63602.1 MAG: hypothetical protein COW12_09830 [Candidatus Omnitrophica bacterium CG12_big_fil_rev_8_21_14_0_65_45_16]